MRCLQSTHILLLSCPETWCRKHRVWPVLRFKIFPSWLICSWSEELSAQCEKRGTDFCVWKWKNLHVPWLDELAMSLEAHAGLARWGDCRKEDCLRESTISEGNKEGPGQASRNGWGKQKFRLYNWLHLLSFTVRSMAEKGCLLNFWDGRQKGGESLVHQGPPMWQWSYMMITEMRSPSCPVMLWLCSIQNNAPLTCLLW